MSIWRYILPKIDLLTIQFTAEDEYSLWLVQYSCAKPNASVAKGQVITNIGYGANRLSKNPLIIIFCGYGVIGKNALVATDIVNKIDADRETFLCTTIQKTNFFFVRRTQIDSIIDELKSNRAKIADIQCVDIKIAKSCAFLKESAQTAHNEITFKQLFQLTDKMSNILQLVCYRLRLPLLFICLTTLVANFFINQSISSDLEQQSIQLKYLKQIVGTTESKERNEKQLIERFNNRLPYSCAWIFDRIAMLKPYGIRLTTLALQPLKRPIRANNEVVVSDSLVAIKGVTDVVHDVSTYISKLQDEPFANSVKLISLAQQRAGDTFTFQIDIKL